MGELRGLGLGLGGGSFGAGGVFLPTALPTEQGWPQGQEEVKDPHGPGRCSEGTWGAGRLLTRLIDQHDAAPSSSETQKNCLSG